MKTIHVVAAIIIWDHKVFATQRGYGEFKDGWEFPGGKVEPGETDQEALRRELKELMGIDVEVKDRLLHIRHAYDDYDIDFRVYVCDLISDDIAHLRVHDHRWVPEEELDSYEFPAADKKTLDMLLLTPVA